MKRLLNAVKQPLCAAGRAYNNVAVAYPMRTGIVTTVVKTSAADLFAQKVCVARGVRRRRRCALSLSRRPLSMLMNHTATLTHTPLPIKVMEKREEVDWRRHGVFCTFGLFYLVRF